MSTKQPPFKYPKLKRGQIRLLKPEPDDLSGLKWELESVQLLHGDGDDKAGSPCDYDALSYTWGEPGEGDFHITCNGKTLKVWKNLYSALPCLARQLRQEGSSPRRIWIDAVCINQSDESEKLEQIDRMSAIYRRARQVIVWFGPGHGKDDNDAAIALLPLLSQIGAATMKYFMKFHRTRPDFSEMDLPDASSPVWEVLSDIIFSEWYTRLWVVQELLLAQSTVALIGDSTIDFDTLEDALGLVAVLVTGRSVKVGPGIEALQKECIKRKVDFLRLVDSFRLVVLRCDFKEAPDMDTQQTSHTSVFQNADRLLTGISMTVMCRQCKDPRDHVFGVLGFSGNDEIEALGLKDKKDLAELYTVFMGYVFESGKRIVEEHLRRTLWEVFGNACLPNKILRLPSWCPDLQMQREPSTPHAFSVLSRREFAGRNLDSIMGVHLCGYIYEADDGELDMRMGESEKVLVLKGTVFDGLEEVFPTFPELDLHSRLTENGELERITNMHASIGQWEKRIAAMVFDPREVGTGYRGPVSLDTYWRTLVGNHTVHSASDSEFTCETLCALRDSHVRISRMKTELDELKQRYGSFDAIFSEGGYTMTREDEKHIAGDSHPQVSSFSRNMIEAQIGRQLFTTADGRFGFGHMGIREGDVVCIFNGAPTAHVLRKASGSGDGDGTYTLEAAAYIHGMMNGEIKKLGLEAEEIRLV